MFKTVLGGLINSGINPQIDEIPVNQPTDSKGNNGAALVLGGAFLLLLAILYLTAKS